MAQEECLNWCPDCWFSGNGNFYIGFKPKITIRKWLCLSCGGQGDFLGNSLSYPRYFTDDEWDLIWEVHFKEKKV